MKSTLFACRRILLVLLPLILFSASNVEIAPAQGRKADYEPRISDE